MDPSSVLFGSKAVGKAEFYIVFVKFYIFSSLNLNGLLHASVLFFLWFNSIEGLYITALLGIIFVLFFNITAITSITSSIFTYLQ